VIILGSHFGIDLMHRKAEVKDIITDAINEMSDDDDDEEEEDAGGAVGGADIKEEEEGRESSAPAEISPDGTRLRGGVRGSRWRG